MKAKLYFDLDTPEDRKGFKRVNKVDDLLSFFRTTKPEEMKKLYMILILAVMIGNIISIITGYFDIAAYFVCIAIFLYLQLTHPV